MTATRDPIFIWVVTEPAQSNPLAPATGCFWGPALGALMWLVIFAIVFGGCAGVPQTIVQVYDYRAQPAPVAPGSPPGLATAPPQPAQYQTIYPSAWDDPTLVVLVNQSARFAMVAIDGGSSFRLGPYQATADLRLDDGEHRVVVLFDVPTAVHGVKHIRREIRFFVHPEGRSQIIPLHE